MKSEIEINAKKVFIGFALLIISFIILLDILFYKIYHFFRREIAVLLYEFLVLIAISLTIFYMKINYKISLIYKIKNVKNSLIIGIGGIFVIWIIKFLSFLFFINKGATLPSIKSFLELPSIYFYIGFIMLVIIGPILEEILFRGFFFEVLRRKWNIKIALAVILLFSAIVHLKYGISVINVIIDNVILTLIYIEGGLIASIIGHIFLNFYMIYFIHL